MGSGSGVAESARPLDDEIDGSATLVTDGRLANEKRSNAKHLTGPGIDGGQSRHVAKGDFPDGAGRHSPMVQEDRRHRRPDVAASPAQTRGQVGLGAAWFSAFFSPSLRTFARRPLHHSGGVTK
jgi:hypothetical protein